ncbi:MAG TPA: FtsX-like permease family protein [Steroidobacteraceae bacterium]|jgi:putative ABC transport system permease protein|nr:FtsX-like permease family protein [Steroidobacteraceae bacterium]
MAAWPLIDAALAGPLRRSPGRNALLAIAIALGVALGFAIYLINRSAADEVSLAARSLYGVADLSIESAAGLDENLYPRIAAVPGVAVASPVVEVEGKLANRRAALTLLGVDAFRSRQLQASLAALAGTMSAGTAAFDPQAIFLSASAARDLQLDTGDVLEIQVGEKKVQLRVAGVLPQAGLEDRAGVLDIAAAQWKFGQLGKLSRINVRLASGASPGQVRADIAALLPPEARVTTPGEASNEALRLSRAYRSNLTALALVALFTGGFFVYSTQSLATLRRRREFAVLHALGVTRGQQLALVLAGAAIIGTCGALLGIVLGIAAARLGLGAIGSDLGAGYFRGLAAALEVHGGEIAAFWVLGVTVAIVGALRPAVEAARVPTASALKAGDVASRELRTHGRIVAVLLLLAALVLLLPPIAGLPLPGFVSIALVMIGVVIAMPSIVRLALRHAPFVRAVPYQIAIAQIAGTARYATLSVSAILVSFSLMVSMAIMVTSFRTSLDQWAQRVLPADVYVRLGYVGQSAHLDASTVQRLGSLPGVAHFETGRFARTQLAADKPLTLVARSANHMKIADALWMTVTAASKAPDDAMSAWVSEGAGDLYGIRAGDTFELSLAGRRVRAFAAGIWRDYEHQNGAVVIDSADYVRLSGDTGVNTVSLWLQPGVDSKSLENAIRDLLPATQYDLRTPPELRRLSLQAFDRTFAITYLLELVAVLIGLFGIAAGISAQVLARRGEFGVLRHLGFTRAQIATMLAIEGAVLGATGVVVGLVTGGIVSLILIYVVNRQSFHWSMDLAAPGVLLASLSAVLVAAAAGIAVISGRQAMSTDVVKAVKEDW